MFGRVFAIDQSPVFVRRLINYDAWAGPVHKNVYFEECFPVKGCVVRSASDPAIR
jgi:hypothetical protein